MIRNPHVGVVLGTRPEVIKNYSIIRALRRRGVPHTILHTGQHSGPSMCDNVFQEMGYQPDHRLEGPYEIGRAISWVRERIRQDGIEIVLVNGDTAASLSGAVAAVYSDVGLAHVEAGLRSRDTEMYEERNRIMVDAASHYLFTYTDWEDRELRATPAMRGRVHQVGNTTVDVIHDFADQLAPPLPGRSAFVTLHRKELLDRPDQLREVLGCLAQLAPAFDRMVFPVHPRTRDVLERCGIDTAALQAIEFGPPLSPLEALRRIRHAQVVITDSGCVQEEACILHVPCVTVRENTERAGTVAIGANVVTGFRAQGIRAAVERQLQRFGTRFPRIYGEPGAGERIVDYLVENFRDFRHY